MKRSTFLKKGLLASGAVIATGHLMAQEGRPLFTKEDIYDFVAAAHNDLNKVMELYEKQPLILNCTNQIRRGDFETAMGGASHMGRKDIADFLLSKGARMDIFSYAFLGYDDFVKQQIETFPHLLHSPGPHGFTLLHHAKVGDRKDLMDWIKEKGLTETFVKGAFG